MQTFESEVILLEQQTGEKEGTYRWRCLQRGDTCDLREISGLLNRFGSDGWRAVGYAPDDRFGPTILLERHASGDTNGATPLKLGNTGKAILNEVKALRSQVDDLNLVHRPMDATARLQEEQRARQTEEAHAALKDALPAILTELQKLPEHLRPLVPSPPEPPPSSIALDDQTIERLAQAFQDAAPTVEIEPTFIPAPQVTVSPTPVHVAPSVTLDAGSIQALANAVAAMPVQANLAPDDVTTLAEVLRDAVPPFREPIAPAPNLDLSEIVTRLEALGDHIVFHVRAAAERIIEGTHPPVVTVEPTPVTVLPAPVAVQPAAPIDAQLLESLLAALAERQLPPLPAAPVVVPPIDVAPLLQVLEPLVSEMRTSRVAPPVQLSRSTIAELSLAISEALLPALVPPIPIPEPEPQPIPEEDPEPEPNPTPWWARFWPWGR